MSIFKYVLGTRYSVLSIALFFFGAFRTLQAQVAPCSTGCMANPDPNAYTTINIPANTTVNVSTLIGTTLLAFPVAATTQQLLKINGVLTVDVPYTFANSELIFETVGSGLSINSELTISNSNLHGCNTMWDGISVGSGGTIRVSNTCLQDGFQAIRLLDGSQYEVVGCTFSKNLTSLFAGTSSLLSPPASITPIGGGIVGCDFSGTGTLLPPNNGAGPEVGIRVANVVTFFIGSTNAALNNFHDYLTPNPSAINSKKGGIFITNAVVTVEGSVFSNFNDFSAPIQLETNPLSTTTWLPAKLYVTGIGGIGAASPTFSNHVFGIAVTTAAFVEVKDAWFSNASEVHIRFEQPFGTNHSFYIHDCFFEAYRGGGIFAAIGEYNKCRIENNLFEDTLPILSGGFSSSKRSVSATGVPGSPLPSFPRLNIIGNTFIEGQKPTTATTGISHIALTNMNGLASIKGNRFEQNHTPGTSQTHVYHGVLLNNSSSNMIEDNEFTASSINQQTAPQVQDRMAIFANASGKNSIKCNTMNNTNVGIRFTGMSCNGTNLEGNSFGTHRFGLQLSDPTTVIGVQGYRQNSWPANTTVPNNEAIFDGNPTSVQISLSRFIIENTESSVPTRYANPRTPTSWFTPQIPEAGLNAPCTGTPGPGSENAVGKLTALDKAVLTGDAEAFGGFSALRRDAEFDTYRLLIENPDLVVLDADAGAFWSAKQNSSTQKLYDIYTKYGSAFSISPSMEAQLESITDQEEVLLQSLKAKLGLLANNPVSDELKSQIANLQQEMTVLGQTKSALINQNGAIRSQWLQEASALLQAFSSEWVDEQNLKQLLQILTNAFLSTDNPGVLTEAQKQIVEAIAAQCRNNGGFAVDMARGFLHKTSVDYSDAAICAGDRNSEENGQSVRLTLSPSPATDFLNLQVEEAYKSGEIRFFDLNGRLLQISALTGSRVQAINIAGMPTGIIVAHVYLDGHEHLIQRVVKI